MAEARRLKELADRLLVDLPPGPLAVALSGGADSAALLWLCARQGREVRAVHVHHGLAASDTMAAAAETVAAAVGVPLEVVRVEVTVGPSFENQARQARYRALEGARRPGEWILTAHTSDDQAETVIDRLLRGSGIDGLAGIPPRRDPFVRPLLTVSRAETRELATLAGLAWRDDPLNQDPHPRRNRIRHRLIPSLEAEFNPRLRSRLADTAALLAQDAVQLDSALGWVSYHQIGRRFEVAASVVSTATPSAAGRIVRRLLELAGAGEVSSRAVEGVREVAEGKVDSRQVGGGVVVRRRGAMLVAEPSPPGETPPVELEVPGFTRFGPWLFTATVSTRPPAAMPLGPGWMVADADRSRPLTVVGAGSVPGLEGWLAGAGVGAADRPHHPVVVSGDTPLWIPSVRRFPAGWVEQATERYLVVRMGRTCRRFEP
ncbi:MAG TPA: tRNA lysidine(34) synthetase TilS [Longimicrobiales bacterium]|nr:tRNA lysidine(34) synthetase TilS [Longimicrobiales bacterium]